MISNAQLLSANRQAIAYDLQEDPERIFRFEIFEPDCVCVEHAIVIDLRGERPRVKEVCPPEPPIPLAGLLCEVYEQAPPPLECHFPFPKNKQLSQQYRRFRHRVEQVISAM